MRFLKMLFRYFVMGGIFLLILGLIISQVFLFMNAIKVSDSLSKVKRLSKNPNHVSDCVAVSGNDEFPIKGYQLRFVNDEEYVLEAICTSSIKGPFEVSKESLFLGVKKLSGYSGVFFPTISESDLDGRLLIGLWKFKWLIEIGDVSNIKFTPTMDDDVSPGLEAASATCEGWGYRCCNSLTEVGVGEKIDDGVLDCSIDCFSSCKERPSILIFTSDPEMGDPRERIVRVSKKEPLVLFSYSVQDSDSQGVEISIDFGDGETSRSSNTTDQFSHFYNCEKSACKYTAKLSAVDDEGYDNSRTRISEIYVVVR